MLMPGREYGALGRFGFNGKEQDSEVSGEGNQYDYGFRIYDPRLVRFKSVDPLAVDYPWYSPYHFAGNNPIMFVDLDGAEPQGFMEYWDKQTDGTDKWGRTVQNVHDYQTKQVWSVMREPNSTRVYFWQQYDNEHGNWDNDKTNNNFDNQNDKWKGKWVEFKPRHTSEMGGQIADAFGIGAFSIAAVGAAIPAVANLAPLAFRGIVNEASLLKFIPKAWGATAKMFGANVGLQVAFNGKDADVWDAVTATWNPWAAFITNPVVNYKPGAGNIIPTIGVDPPEVMAKKFAVSAPFFMLGISMKTLDPNGYTPSTDYMMNVVEEATDNSISEDKLKVKK